MKTELIEKLEKLPDALQKEVKDFVDFLIYKDQKKDGTEKLSDKTMNVPRPVFGSGKGIFGKMSDDFDEPLDEMKEYM
ncbi:MAG: DUF2281 domain-containing protein [Mucilaginibacter sp.]|uniref:type II toxin-antitoxin system VapB family antitoxin n=1 Tax=Mucilaginibacter sp. TaxID=1882438 RepID=UPI0034E3D41D